MFSYLMLLMLTFLHLNNYVKNCIEQVATFVYNSDTVFTCCILLVIKNLEHCWYKNTFVKSKKTIQSS